MSLLQAGGSFIKRKRPNSTSHVLHHPQAVYQRKALTEVGLGSIFLVSQKESDPMHILSWRSYIESYTTRLKWR